MIWPLPDSVRITELSWKDVSVELESLSAHTRQYQEIIHYTSLHRGRTLLSQVEGQVCSGEVQAVLYC